MLSSVVSSIYQYCCFKLAQLKSLSDLGDYPKSHEYCVFTGEDAPAALAQALSTNLPSTRGKDITTLLTAISATLTRSLVEQQNGSFNADSQPASDDEDDFDDYDDYDDYDINQDRLTAAHIAQQAARVSTHAGSTSAVFRHLSLIHI